MLRVYPLQPILHVIPTEWSKYVGLNLITSDLYYDIKISKEIQINRDTSTEILKIAR